MNNGQNEAELSVKTLSSPLSLRIGGTKYTKKYQTLWSEKIEPSTIAFTVVHSPTAPRLASIIYVIDNRNRIFSIYFSKEYQLERIIDVFFSGCKNFFV